MLFFAYIKCSFLSFLRSHLYLCNTYIFCVGLKKSAACVLEKETFYSITKEQAPLKYYLLFVNVNNGFTQITFI